MEGVDGDQISARPKNRRTGLSDDVESKAQPHAGRELWNFTIKYEFH